MYWVEHIFIVPKPTLDEISKVYNNNGTITALCNCKNEPLPPPFPTCDFKCRISKIFHAVRLCHEPKMNIYDMLYQVSLKTDRDMACVGCRLRYGFYIPCFYCKKLYCPNCVTTTHCDFCKREYNIGVQYLIKNQIL